MNTLYLGIDVGSSSVKTAIFDAATGHSVGRVSRPAGEQRIESRQPGWAEQDPEMWWSNFLDGYKWLVKEHLIDTSKIEAIGISYQMHGLVLVDETLSSIRNSIIWCDSRAVEIGHEALETMGASACLPRLLNSPGNFTASKLAWVKANEPEVFKRIRYFMLPGDYIALKLTGRVTTTLGGLSEGILLDFVDRKPSQQILDHFQFDDRIIPELVPAIGDQGQVAPTVANELGLHDNVRITYRAGDQPNNALSLNVREPGEVAATAGTSGVIYAVTDKDVYDPASRINTFLHPTDSPGSKRNGILICVNGSGILYSWVRRLLSVRREALDYRLLNELVSQAPPGSDELQFFPFGNGAERILSNRRINASIANLDFNRHEAAHIVRAGVEGIVYALNLGLDILRDLGVNPTTIRAGNANLFLNPEFGRIFANVTGTVVEIQDTDGADGAARAAAIGAGFYQSIDEAYDKLELVTRIQPDQDNLANYREHFEVWRRALVDRLES